MMSLEIIFQDQPGKAAQPDDAGESFPLQSFVGRQHLLQLLEDCCLIRWQKNVIAGLLLNFRDP